MAADHFIRAGATGSGTGNDWTNACPDFTGSCAISSLVRGDTYYIADGSYSSYNFNKATSGTSLITIKKATASDHGTASGWNSAYGDGVVTFNGQINFTTSYWVFDGAVGGGPGSWTRGFGFKINKTGPTPALRTGAVNNITIRHIEVQGNFDTSGGGSIAQDAFAVYGGTNITLSYYYLYNVGRCPFFLSTQDFVAEYGYTGQFRGTSAAHSELASIWGFSIPANRVTFRYNVFTHMESTGGLMFDNHEAPTAGGMKVYGNVFYRPLADTWSGGNGAIGGWTGNGGEQFHDVEVYDNTFINVNIPPLTTLPRVFSGNKAYNNLFYNSSAPSFGVFTMHDYNAFYNSGGTAGEANAQTGTGNPFIDIVNEDFHLIAPTKAGITLPAPFDVDPDGVKRGASGIWNRGAFELSAGLRPNAPTNLLTLVK
jgi:hypothetical protein